MINQKFDRLFNVAHPYKTLVTICIDTILIFVALYLAYLIRLGSIEAIGIRHNQIFFLALMVIPSKIAVFWMFRLYHISFRYISLEEVLSIIKASALSSPLIGLIALVFRDFKIFSVFPRSVIFIDFFLTFFFVTAIRASVRLYYSRFNSKTGMKTKTLVVGGGAAGEQLVRDIARSQKFNYLPVGFIDDNPRKRNSFLHGIKVLGGKEDIPKLAERLKIEAIIIAIPSAASEQIKAIMGHVRKTNIKDVKVLPGFSDLINGKVTLSDVRDISIEDLLGREPVKIDMKQVSSFIENKTILVTGAGGSIGSELCRQVARFNPAKLMMLDRGETELFHIDREITERYPDLSVATIVGDIQDENRIKGIFEEQGVDTVFHAAAYKHVPLMEINPREAILNNIYGTRTLATASITAEVKRFIFISTDKAVNPESVMGATKRIAENLIRGLSNKKTEFIAVRFGNVIGSRGSVIPVFREQIRKGGPVTITDYEMKRYFMTIPEAVQLVMQAGAMGKGGEVFVLDMGDPVSIYQVAEELIKLSGLEPDKDIPIVISGKRPGEKLFEELLTAEEGVSATLHEKIFSAKNTAVINKNYLEKIDELIASARENKSGRKIFSLLKGLVPAYQMTTHKEDE